MFLYTQVIPESSGRPNNEHFATRVVGDEPLTRVPVIIRGLIYARVPRTIAAEHVYTARLSPNGTDG